VSVKHRIEVERKIVRAFIREALAKGYSVSVYNGGDEPEIDKSRDETALRKAVMLSDDDRIYLFIDNERVGWAWFVYGNDGWDVISDYTANAELEELVEAGPVADLVKRYEP